MDDWYKGLNRKQTIEMIYDLNLQNANGRETALEMYKLGIEHCYDELSGGWDDKNKAERDCNITLVNVALPLDEFDKEWKKLRRMNFEWEWIEKDGCINKKECLKLVKKLRRQ